jgi:hypothetical protein
VYGKGILNDIFFEYCNETSEGLHAEFTINIVGSIPLLLNLIFYTGRINVAVSQFESAFAS